MLGVMDPFLLVTHAWLGIRNKRLELLVSARGSFFVYAPAFFRKEGEDVKIYCYICMRI